MISTVNQIFSIKIKDIVMSHTKINKEEKTIIMNGLLARCFSRMNCDHLKTDHHHHHHHHLLTEEQLTVSHLQLARSWAVHKMSSSKKSLLGSIYSWTWLEKDLCSLLEGLIPWRRRGSYNA